MKRISKYGDYLIDKHGEGWQNRLNDIAFEDDGENQSDIA